MAVVLALLVGLLLGAVPTRHLVHRHLVAESHRAIRQLRATLDALEAAHGIALAAAPGPARAPGGVAPARSRGPT